MTPAVGRDLMGTDGCTQETAMSGGALAKDRLERLHDVMSGFVERGTAPGLVTVVSRRGGLLVGDGAPASAVPRGWRFVSRKRRFPAAIAILGRGHRHDDCIYRLLCLKV